MCGNDNVHHKVVRMSEKIPVQELTPHSIDGQYKGVSAKYNDKLYVRSVNGLFNKMIYFNTSSKVPSV